MLKAEQENKLVRKYLTHTLGNGDKELIDKQIRFSSFRKKLLYQAKVIDYSKKLKIIKLEINLK